MFPAFSQASRRESIRRFRKCDVGAAPIRQRNLHRRQVVPARPQSPGRQGRQGATPASPRRRRHRSRRRARTRDPDPRRSDAPCRSRRDGRRRRQRRPIAEHGVAGRLFRRRFSRADGEDEGRGEDGRRSCGRRHPVRARPDRADPGRRRRRGRHGGGPLPRRSSTGSPAISLVIKKQTGTNTVAVADAVGSSPRRETARRTRQRQARHSDGQLRLHRAVDPRRAVRSDVRCLPRRRHHSALLARHSRDADQRRRHPDQCRRELRVHAMDELHVQQHDDARAVALDRNPDRRRDRRHREHPSTSGEGVAPDEGGLRRAAQIFLAVLATTSSILAVFVPSRS